MLMLFSAELHGGDEDERLIASLPADSQNKVSGRFDRHTSSLGEFLRLHMMDVCGAPYDVAKGQYGKPYCPGRRDIAYNISHSRNLAAGALLTEDSGEIGIDIEFIDRSKSARHERIAARFFTESEREVILAADDAVREFYLTWTRKEAYLKYDGSGITRPLTEVDTATLPDVTFDSRIIYDRYGGEYAFTVCVGADVGDIRDTEIKKIY